MMFKPESFEMNFTWEYRPLNFDILSNLFHKIANQSQTLIIHVEEIDSIVNRSPDVWISFGSDQPFYYFHPTDLNPGWRYMLQQIFKMKSLKKIMYNGASEIRYLRSLKLPIKGQLFDISVVNELLEGPVSSDGSHLDDVIASYLSDQYENLPSLKSEGHREVQDYMEDFVMCLNLFFPLRKKMINKLEDNRLMTKAKKELAKLKKLSTH